MLDEFLLLREFEAYCADLREFLAYRQALRERYELV